MGLSLVAREKDRAFLAAQTGQIDAIVSDLAKPYRTKQEDKSPCGLVYRRARQLAQ
jgi:hypothetical protein